MNFSSVATTKMNIAFANTHFEPVSDLALKVKVLVARSCPTLWPHGLKPASLLCPWDSPGKNNGAGCHFLLQGIFLTQESNPGLLHCRQILYHLSYQEIPYFRAFHKETHIIFVFLLLMWKMLLTANLKTNSLKKI